MNKYTDYQIADACIKCIDPWDMDTLVSFAIEEMYHHYTEVASPESLDAFMEENDD